MIEKYSVILSGEAPRVSEASRRGLPRGCRVACVGVWPCAFVTHTHTHTQSCVLARKAPPSPATVRHHQTVCLRPTPMAAPPPPIPGYEPIFHGGALAKISSNSKAKLNGEYSLQGPVNSKQLHSAHNAVHPESTYKILDNGAWKMPDVAWKESKPLGAQKLAPAEKLRGGWEDAPVDKPSDGARMVVRANLASLKSKFAGVPPRPAAPPPLPTNEKLAAGMKLAIEPSDETRRPSGLVVATFPLLDEKDAKWRVELKVKGGSAGSRCWRRRQRRSRSRTRPRRSSVRGAVVDPDGNRLWTPWRTVPSPDAPMRPTPRPRTRLRGRFRRRRGRCRRGAMRVRAAVVALEAARAPRTPPPPPPPRAEVGRGRPRARGAAGAARGGDAAPTRRRRSLRRRRPSAEAARCCATIAVGFSAASGGGRGCARGRSSAGPGAGCPAASLRCTDARRARGQARVYRATHRAPSSSRLDILSRLRTIVMQIYKI